MQVSIAPAPDAGTHFKCYACDGKIEAVHVLATTDRKTRHLCNATCYAKWRSKSHKEAA